MNDMQLQCIGMLIAPLLISLFGLGYLFLAWSHENYVNKKGQAYYCKFYPEEYPPHDASSWYLMELEEKERIKKEGKK